MAVNDAPAQRKKEPRRFGNSRALAKKRAQAAEKRQKGLQQPGVEADEGFGDDVEMERGDEGTKDAHDSAAIEGTETERGGEGAKDVLDSSATEGMEIERECEGVDHAQNSAAVDSMGMAHEEEGSKRSTNDGREDHKDGEEAKQGDLAEAKHEGMVGIEHHFGTAVMQGLQFRPKDVSDQAAAAAIPTMPIKSEDKPASEVDAELLKQFCGLKVEPTPKRDVGPPSRLHALEMKNKALEAKISQLEKELTQEKQLNAELTAITRDLARNAR